MDLITETTQALALDSQHTSMVARIVEALPAIDIATANHNKSHTQYQMMSVDMSGPIAGPTKLRNARALLSGIDRTRAAIEEASFKARKLQLRAEKYREQATSKDGIDYELCIVSAEELEAQLGRIQSAMHGAIRKLLTLTEQYQHIESVIRKDLGKADDDPITEADFEADEERFHIMKAFEQALIASRSLGGPRIDQGNLIYLHDLGINGQCALHDLAGYWEMERDIGADESDVHAMFALENDWLEDMARRYAGCGSRYAEARGLKPIVSTALLQ